MMIDRRPCGCADHIREDGTWVFISCRPHGYDPLEGRVVDGCKIIDRRNGKPYMYDLIDGDMVRPDDAQPMPHTRAWYRQHPAVLEHGRLSGRLRGALG